MALSTFTPFSNAVTGPRGPSEGRPGPSAPKLVALWWLQLLCRRSDVRLRLSLVADRLENAVRAMACSGAGLLHSHLLLCAFCTDRSGRGADMHCEALSYWSDGRRSDAGRALPRQGDSHRAAVGWKSKDRGGPSTSMEARTFSS